jgi:hypothetical protein
VVVIKMSGLHFGRKDFFNVVALLAASEAAEKSIQRVQAVHPVDNGIDFFSLRR